jgi:hypothetical protein
MPATSRADNVITKRATVDGFEPLCKSINMQFIHVSKPITDYGLTEAYSSLKKALTAGSGNAAPSSLTGGEALGKEQNIDKLYRYFGKKLISKSALKKALPHLSDEKASQIVELINEKHRKNH